MHSFQLIDVLLQKPMSFKRLVLLPIVSAFGCLIAQPPSQALPGQTLGEVQDMVRRSETFSGRSLEREEWLGEVSYIASTTNGNKGIVLYVYEENGIVTSETLQYRYPNFPVAFERDNQTGLRLIEAMWGRSVVEDFVNSRYTDAILDPGFGRPDHFYLGERYGYKVSYSPEHNGNSAIYTLGVTNHSVWERWRRIARFCLNNPNHNDCSGL